MSLASLLSDLTQPDALSNLTEKLGVSPEIAQKLLSSVATHADAGVNNAEDLSQKVATATGLDSTQINAMLPNIVDYFKTQGGRLGDNAQGLLNTVLGPNTQLGSALSGLDANGDGSIVDDVTAGAARLVTNLFTKNG